MDKKKIIALVLIILIAILIAGINIFNKNKNANATELTLYGNIEIRQVDLSFQVPGLVSKLLKEEGDTVKKGELVAVIDEKTKSCN